MFRLGLDLTETVIFAIIYGFSQDGETRFRGSWKYLQDHALCSRAKVARALKRLVELRYVRKIDKVVNGIKFCEYCAEIGSGNGFAGGITEILPVSKRDLAVSTEDRGGISERPNNIEDNKDNNIVDTTRACARDTARKKFDFKAALISAGISELYTDKLIAIRKSKRLTNSLKAFNDLNAAITTICNTYGVLPDEVVKFCVDRNWGAIRPDWDGVEHIKANIRRRGVAMSIDDLINKEMAQLR